MDYYKFIPNSSEILSSAIVNSSINLFRFSISSELFSINFSCKTSTPPNKYLKNSSSSGFACSVSMFKNAFFIR